MDVQPGQDVAVDSDVRYLERLGYRQQLSRVMGIWPNFALGFTYLSPVVGIYTLFAYALATGGGASFWAIPIVVAGQLMVSSSSARSSPSSRSRAASTSGRAG